ncbi:hypothetical protein Q9233_001065 [Columba guinea]|nr:hypothetical protein Q9233_001065 [Columba guinea]
MDQGEEQDHEALEETHTGNGKGTLGVKSDDEAGFNVTSVVESTYGQDGDGDAVPQKFLQS